DPSQAARCRLPPARHTLVHPRALRPGAQPVHPHPPRAPLSGPLPAAIAPSGSPKTTRPMDRTGPRNGQRATSWCRIPPVGSAPSRPEGAAMDFKLELVIVPVTDVDRAKAFYVERAG